MPIPDPTPLDADAAVPWWVRLPKLRLVLGLVSTLAALPIVLFDHLPSGPGAAEAVEVVAPVHEPVTSTAPPTTRPTKAHTASTTSSTTAAPTTTAAPVVAAVVAPPTTARPTTTTAPRPPTTAAPPPTAPPTTPPPPPTTAAPGSVESIIRSVFGAAAGDDAVKVARCESGLNPNAHNPAGYYGLFQIGQSHAARFQQVTGQSFESAWNDPTANSQYAKYLYDQSGWGVWGCPP